MHSGRRRVPWMLRVSSLVECKVTKSKLSQSILNGVVMQTQRIVTPSWYGHYFAEIWWLAPSCRNRRAFGVKLLGACAIQARSDPVIIGYAEQKFG